MCVCMCACACACVCVCTCAWQERGMYKRGAEGVCDVEALILYVFCVPEFLKSNSFFFIDVCMSTNLLMGCQRFCWTG